MKYSLEEVFSKSGSKLLIILILIVIILWMSISLALFYYHHSYTQYMGTLGDTLGIINSLFSAMAFAGVVYSLIQQTRLTELQRFDGAFYNLLQVFNSMKTTNFPAKKFEEHHGNNIQKPQFKEVTGGIDKLKKAYNETGAFEFILHDEFKKNFSQYLASFESMVELIINDSPQKNTHLKIFFGQLTNLEKISLLYHFHLGDRPKYFDEIKGPLFKTLREFPNQVYSPHSDLFDGMREH